MGCRLTAMYPFGRVFQGTGLNITAMSLTGKLNIWLVACKELLPDLWRLADDFEAALKELLEALSYSRRLIDGTGYGHCIGSGAPARRRPGFKPSRIVG
jgi:hypothetical protein